MVSYWGAKQQAGVIATYKLPPVIILILKFFLFKISGRWEGSLFLVDSTQFTVLLLPGIKNNNKDISIVGLYKQKSYTCLFNIGWRSKSWSQEAHVKTHINAGIL